MKQKSKIFISLIITALVGGFMFWNFDANRASAQTKEISDTDNTPNVFQPITVNVAASDGTATVADNDYQPLLIGTNLALSGTASQSSTSYGGVASRANDGNTDGDFYHNSVSHTDAQAQPYWDLDLGAGNAAQTLDRINVWNRTDGGYGINTVNFHVFVSDNPFTGTTVAASQAQPGVQDNFNAAEAGRPTTIDIANRTGRYIRVQLESAHQNLNLAEVEVFPPVTSCLPAPANLQVFVPGENSPSDMQSVNTNASLVGDTTYTNMGKVGRAFSFDGAGDYVRIEDNAAQKPANQLTLEGWFKFNDTAGFLFLAAKPFRSSNTRSYALWSSNGSIQIEYNSTGGSVLYNTGIAPPVNAWTHYAMVVNTDDTGATANTIKLYANGVEVYSNTANNPIVYDGINNANTPLPFLIGGGFDSSNNPNYNFNGQADEVSIYGRALTQSEIFDIVQTGSFGKCAPAACVQSPNNLVSWFAGEQNAVDSRSNNHGALFGGVTFPGGKVGQSFGFDGTNDYVQSPSFNLGSNYSLEFWMYPTTSSDGVNIVSNDFSSPANYGGLYFYTDAANSGHLEYFSNSLSRAATPADSVPRNAWSHIGLTYDGSITRLYINGSLAATSSGHPETFNNSVVFGSGNNSGASYFQGNLDEISFYNRVLSASEVSSIAGAGQSGKCKPVGLNPAANQIAWYSGDGDARDFTNLNPTGTINGDANFRNGRVGQAFNFDGNGDNIEVANNANLNPTSQLTIETWVYVTNYSGGDIVSKDGETSERQYFLVAANNARFRPHLATTNNGIVFFDGNTPYQLNQWNHVAMTYNGAALMLYVNGVLDGSTAASGSIIATTQPLRIGGGAPTGQLQNFFDGRLDEVSLYSRALLPSEIAAIYNAGTAGKLKSVATPVNSARSAKTSASFAPTTVQLTDATVNFAQVNSAGATSQSGVDLGLLPPLPAQVTFTGLAYDISTTATFTTAKVCFNLPSISDSNQFLRLRILHLEGANWINRTDSTTLSFSSKTICTSSLSNLSPFAIVQGVSPTAATVSVGGRVTNLKGGGIARVKIKITDANGRTFMTTTNAFGYYRFDEIGVGEIYVVSASSKLYQFSLPTRMLNVTEDVNDLDFTAYLKRSKSERTGKSL